MATQKSVIIIGAGPAGLTAAYELLKIGGYKVTIVEKTTSIGGISQTVNVDGNRIDIGGHRFFTKSDWVMDFWKTILPLQAPQNPSGPNPDKTDLVFLVRSRLSRILFVRKLFPYPLKLSLQVLSKLGMVRVFKILFSYILVRIRPAKDTGNLESFFINRFGKELYLTFFKSYTEKVWGKPCREISAEWGAQRIKGLSITKALLNAFQKLFKLKSNSFVETSLIEEFYYPKLGPGQLWETVADKIKVLGGTIVLNSTVARIERLNEQYQIDIQNDNTSSPTRYLTDIILSSMPIKDLLTAYKDTPSPILALSSKLEYRDFITVGVLIKRNPNSKSILQYAKDNWIYVQEADVLVGRLQLFHNWSPYLVKAPDTLWIGMEYFCFEGDSFWNKTDTQLSKLANDELVKLDLAEISDIISTKVIRIEKAYPAYFGTYSSFPLIREYVNTLPNLFPIGRNGMHRYNNMDHSMLTARESVRCILDPTLLKSKIWEINAEEEYHESKSE